MQTEITANYAIEEQARQQTNSIRRLPQIARLLFLISLLLSWIAYFSPWISHPVSGLVVTGIDIGEYVKFLPSVRNGNTFVWRESFYLPLLAITMACTLSAYRRELAFPYGLRTGLQLVAIFSVCNLLPPAWTPGRMLQPEFRFQLFALLAGLVAVVFSPLLSRLPIRIYQALLMVMTVAAVVLPVTELIDIMPLIRDLYQQSLPFGVGLYLLIAALIGVGASPLLVTRYTIFPAQALPAAEGNNQPSVGPIQK